MSTALNAIPTATPPTPAPTDAEAEFQRQTIHDLTAWCADVAYRLRNAVENATMTDDLIPLAAAFDTAARSVRRAVILARHVARAPRAEQQRPTPPSRPRRPGPVLRLADRETPDRLDTPDPAPDSRPIAEQIAEIRRDLEPLAAAYPMAGPTEPPTEPATTWAPPTPSRTLPPHAPSDPPPIRDD